MFSKACPSVWSRFWSCVLFSWELKWTYWQCVKTNTRVKCFKIFWYLLVYSTKQFKLCVVITERGSIVVVDTLTRASLLSVCDFKAAQMNMPRILICEHMLYEFEPGDNTAEAIPKIFVVRKINVPLIITLYSNSWGNFPLASRT